MESKKLIVTASPHITDRSSTRGLMGNVIFALLPTLVAASFIFGARALLLTGVTVAACVGFEALWCVLRKQPQTVGDLSAVVTGLILAFNLPSTLPLWIAVLGSFISIVLVKMLFGGLGANFANPALVGRIVLFVSFAAHMTSYGWPVGGTVDALASATPLVATKSIAASSVFLQLLLGAHGGVLGETCALTLLLGGIYLIATKTISAAIPVSYLASAFCFGFVFRFLDSFEAGTSFGSNFLNACAASGGFAGEALCQLFMGGLLLCAFFMATDYVTSPFTTKGRIFYGIGLGLITCVIRFYGSMAEGVSYALLLMNLLVPYLNDLTRQKPLGGVVKQ